MSAAARTGRCKSGYRLFGFDDVAELISDIGLALTLPKLLDLQEASFGHRYSKSVPDDSALANRFEEYFKMHKSAFAPLPDDSLDQLKP